MSSAMKRVTAAHPERTMDVMDGLQSDIAAIDQASTQWTLALLFDMTKHLQSGAQRARSVEIMQRNLVEHTDWIVLNNTMQVLFDWSEDDRALRAWLRPELERLTGESRQSVAKRARKLLGALDQ